MKTNITTTTTTIYIVTGCCGEFQNYRNWTVKAFSSQELAIPFLHKCELAIYNVDDDILRSPDFVHPYDPLYEHDYDGTRYYVARLELVCALEAEKCPDCGQRYDEPNGKMNDL